MVLKLKKKKEEELDWQENQKRTAIHQCLSFLHLTLMMAQVLVMGQYSDSL